jgi:hypothetical protein
MVENNQEYLDEQLTMLLDRHGEGLIRNGDRSEELAQEYGETFPALVGLMSIARRLRETLVPVRPDETFVAELRTRLLSMEEKDERAATVWSRLRSRLYRHSAAVGTVISVLAVVAMAMRVVGSIIMVIVLITDNRRRRRAMTA